MNPDLQNQLNELKDRMDRLENSYSIPLSVDRAFQGRGFLKKEFIYSGEGTLNVSGEYRQVIPGASERSIALVTRTNGSLVALISADIVPSSSSPGSYEIYVEGTATEQFNFVVILDANIST